MSGVLQPIKERRASSPYGSFIRVTPDIRCQDNKKSTITDVDKTALRCCKAPNLVSVAVQVQIVNLIDTHYRYYLQFACYNVTDKSICRI